MSRALLIIRGEMQRQRAIEWCKKAPEGTRIEFKEEKRSREQNDRFWATVSDIAAQAVHFGRKYPPETWRTLFIHAWQREVRMVPSLDGTEVVPLTRSSDLSKREMSELLDFIAAWAVEHKIELRDNKEMAA